MEVLKSSFVVEIVRTFARLVVHDNVTSVQSSSIYVVFQLIRNIKPIPRP
jgi:hypothetical protein